MRIKERIGPAQYSKDLGEVPPGEIGDIDIIRACGMVGVSMPLGVSLWRLKVSGDTREYPSVIEGLVALLMRRGAVELEAVKLVNIVLRHYMNDLCQPCKGRGYELFVGAPVLSDRLCSVCAGQGRISLSETDDSAAWLLDQIARLEREVASAIMKKLARELEF